MEEETQTTDSGETEVTETLDDVISGYQAPQPQVHVEPQKQEYRPQQVKFDPLDENSANQFAEHVTKGQEALSSQLRELSDKLTHYEQKEAESRIETEINKAVESVNDGLNLDPDLVRTYLEYTASKKPAFKQVWDNRHNDAKTFNRALAALKKEMGNKFSVRQDSELTETQAAIQQSQRSLASRSKEKSDNPLDEMLAGAKSEAEFDRIWREATG